MTARTDVPTAADARTTLMSHPRYRYRGCASDLDLPSRAAGNLDLSIDAWGPYTGDGAEPQRHRLAREEAAIDVCVGCPVMVQCGTYANTPIVSTDDKGRVTVRLAEPEGIWGGELALDRHRALISARNAATAAQDTIPEAQLAEARTPRKLALLHALAVELFDQRVADRAGMNIRTANWHRSALCSLLGLDKETASRDDLLAAALHHQLLPAGTRVVWDGLWPIAAAPPPDGIRQRRIAPGIPPQLYTPLPKPPRSPGRSRRRPTQGPARAGQPRRRHLRTVPTTDTAGHLPLTQPTPAATPTALEPAA
ncbi:hypothetical protein ACFQ6Q_00275 [Streptomyces sp. NPDC056437]|uniref:hypothetical protein n=1 Tax=Streptomyces sp. NPDC056437 TaxID=3345816 RepID=UPI0036C8B4D6